MLYWSDWLQTRYTSLTCGLVEVKKKIPVQFDQNWLIQGLKRFQRYCYIFCVAAVVVVCYELQQRAVCCVEHNFSFKESVPTTRHYKYKYQISMYRLILLFKSPLRRWILENVTDKYYFRVQSCAKFLLSKPRTLGTVGAPRRVGLLYCCVEKVPSMKQCAPIMTRGSAYGEEYWVVYETIWKVHQARFVGALLQWVRTYQKFMKKTTSNTTHIKNIKRKQIRWCIIEQFEMLFAITWAMALRMKFMRYLRRRAWIK